MRHAAGTGLLAAAAGLALAGCGGSDEDGGGDRPQPSAADTQVITVAAGSMPETLDAAKARTVAERAIAFAIQSPLLTYRRRADVDAATLEPALADALPELSADHTEYRFNLRPGLLYADGRLVKASDVERAIAHATRVAADPELKAALDGIVGAPSEDGETLPGVVTDDRTGVVIVRLRKPDGTVPLALADPATAPLPELPSGKPGALPASTGSLRVARLTDQSVELVANPLRARISTVPAARSSQVSVTAREPTQAALEAEDIDVALAAAGPVAAPDDGGTVEASSGAVWSLVVSPTGRFADRAVRQDLADATDRRGVSGGSVGLVAACGLLPGYVVGAVLRDDCPPAPVRPKDPPLGSVTVRLAVESGLGVTASTRSGAGATGTTPGTTPGSTPSPTTPPSRASVVTTIAQNAAAALGATVVTRPTSDPLAALRDGRADAAIVRADPTLPHPAGWLEPTAAVDELITRQLPIETALPLTGSARQWSSLERRAVARAVAIPVAAERTSAVTGPGVDRGSVVLQPVRGLDLTALEPR